MGKSGKLFKAFVSGVKSFKSPSKERDEKDRPSNKADKDHVRKGGKEKCLWSLGKSSSRNRDSLAAAAAFLDAPEIKSVQVENLHVKDVLITSGSSAPESGNAFKGPNSLQDKSLTGRIPLKLTKDCEQEEFAAVKIQAAIRRYLAVKQVFRALRALVRLQALIRGRIVRKQASTALRCMQALIRVQALARGRRIRSSELGQLIQKHIQQTKQQKKKPPEGWVSSMATVQQLQAKAQSKQDAVMKRQRALVYAFSEQLNRCTSKQTSSSSLDYQPDKSHWGWVWLERWMAAQPAGIPFNVAKEQHNKDEPAKIKPDADWNAEAFELDLSLSKEPVETDDFTSFTGHEDLGIVLDDAAKHAVDKSSSAEGTATTYWAIGESFEQVEDNMVFQAPTDENANVVKRPLTSPPPPPPPPPPFGVKVVAKPVAKPSPPFSVPSPPIVKMAPPPPPPVGTKVVQRSLSPSTPPPPPPPPPHAKKTKPLVANQSSLSSPVGTCSQTAGVLLSTSASELLEGQCSSTRGTYVTLPFSAAPAFPNLPSLSSVTSTAATSYNEPIESLPATSISESYLDPLLTPNQSTPTTSSITLKSGIMQEQCEEATASSMPNALFETLSPSHSSSSPMRFPDVLALTAHPFASSRTPLIIPSATEEDISDMAEKIKINANEDDFTVGGDYEVNIGDVTISEEGMWVHAKVGNANQGEIDMDVDEPDMANVLTIDGPIQVDHQTDANGRGAASGVPTGDKATEVSSNKHTASPTSRQGQLMEALSPSLPNYMTTTKSSKAKIRTPTQKLDSPKQKSDSPKPRFDASKSRVDSPKQKVDSPKQRRDSSKQKADSSYQKADSAAKRRHSLSALEGKGSPGENKSATHVRGSSKGQLVSLMGDTSIEDSPRSNGHSRRLEAFAQT